MELNAYFKSLVDQDRAAVVICDLEHTIIYMNPAAIASYAKHGGAALLGKSVLTCHNPQSRQTIQRVIDWFAADKNHNLVYTYHNVKQNKDVYMVALRDADGTLIGYYEKHEYRSPETMSVSFSLLLSNHNGSVPRYMQAPALLAAYPLVWD